MHLIFFNILVSLRLFINFLNLTAVITDKFYSILQTERPCGRYKHLAKHVIHPQLIKFIIKGIYTWWCVLLIHIFCKRSNQTGMMSLQKSRTLYFQCKVSLKAKIRANHQRQNQSTDVITSIQSMQVYKPKRSDN